MVVSYMIDLSQYIYFWNMYRIYIYIYIYVVTHQVYPQSWSCIVYATDEWNIYMSLYVVMKCKIVSTCTSEQLILRNYIICCIYMKTPDWYYSIFMVPKCRIVGTCTSEQLIYIDDTFLYIYDQYMYILLVIL